MNNAFDSEITLQMAVRSGLEGDGRVVFSEFPLLGKVADFFVIEAGVSTAIECKLKDTGDAVRQARVYQEVADLVYIAMPSRRGPRAWDARLALLGIGLMEVCEDGRIDVIVQALPGSPHRSLRDRAIAHGESRLQMPADAGTPNA